jgi:hypothetical protein
VGPRLNLQPRFCGAWRSSWKEEVMNCHACKCHVTPVPPKTTWKLLSVACWATTLVVAIAFSAFVGIQLLLLPFAIAAGFAVGASARRLTSWTCPRCKTELIVPEPNTTLGTAPLASDAR